MPDEGHWPLYAPIFAAHKDQRVLLDQQDRKDLWDQPDPQELLWQRVIIL